MDLSVTHYSFSKSGGAGIVANRLHDIQVQNDIDSEFYFSTNSTNFLNWMTFPNLLSRAIADQYFLTTRNKPSLFSHFRSSYHRKINFNPKRIAHFHWTPGLVSIDRLKSQLDRNHPLVWTFHDEWPFTGGCHYTGECENYTSDCNSCPQLHSIFKNLNISTKQLQAKIDFFVYFKNLRIVVPSNWLKKKIEKSNFIDSNLVDVIPNPIGFSREMIDYQKVSSLQKKLGIQENDFVVGYCAKNLDQIGKGFRDLLLGIRILKQIHSEINARIVVVAIGEGGHKISANFSDENIRLTGPVNPSEILEYFSLFSVLVNMSNFESFSNIIVEAAACAVPVICKEAGGMSELVESLHHGYSVKSNDELAVNLATLLSQDNLRRRLGEEGKRNLEGGFSEKSINEKYLNVYKKLNLT